MGHTHLTEVARHAWALATGEPALTSGTGRASSHPACKVSPLRGLSLLRPPFPTGSRPWLRASAPMGLKLFDKLTL